MITSKQRAYLRGLANTLPALYQIGKDGISENTVKTINEGLEAKELVKVHVLENSMFDTKEACSELSKLTGAEPVQVIGKKFILYKPNSEEPKIILP